MISLSKYNYSRLYRNTRELSQFWGEIAFCIAENALGFQSKVHAPPHLTLERMPLMSRALPHLVAGLLSVVLANEWTTGSGLPTKRWYAAASSDDGSRLIVGDYDYLGYLWASQDYGASWQATGPANYWHGVAMSSDGMKVVAAAASGNMWTGSLSLSSGEWVYSWVEAEDLSAGGPRNWRDVACDDTCDHVIAADWGGHLWRIVNSGESSTWAQVGPHTGQWFKVAISNNASVYCAAEYDVNLWQSTDHGDTWTAALAVDGTALTLHWHGLTINYDGTRLAAVVDGGSIWISGRSAHHPLIIP